MSLMRVVELFAGVGGFRIGLEGAPDNRLQGPFNIIWANQWEPTTKKQHAAEIYTNAWSLTPSEEDSEIYVGEEEVFVNKDISQIDSSEIPEHDLLCGGFPCQDERNRVWESSVPDYGTTGRRDKRRYGVFDIGGCGIQKAQSCPS